MCQRQLAAIAAMLLCGAAGASDTPPAIGSIDAEALVYTLDRNQNGCLDLEEGRNYTSRRFHALDGDRNNALDATEAPPGPSETTNDRPITIAQWQDAYTARFEAFDTDNSDCLSVDEVKAGRAAAAQGDRR